MSVGEQVAVLYCGMHNLLADIPFEKIAEFETVFLDLMRTSYRETVLQPLAEGCLNDDITGTIEKVAKEVCDSLML